jgi:hypothetical protein
MVASLCWLTPFFGTFLAYWWLQLLAPGDKVELVPRRSPPELSTLRRWNTLHEAMAAYGGDLQALAAWRAGTKRPLLEWLAWASVIALWPLGLAWLYVFDVLSQDSFRIGGYILAGIAGLMLLRTYFLLGALDQGGAEEILAPLGLHEEQTVGRAQEKPVSGLRYTGRRHGREVKITVRSGRSETRIAAKIPSFRIESQEGKLVAEEGAPIAVLQGLKGMRRARRWRGLSINAASGAVVADRHSRGRRMWLYDLWLIERLLAAFEKEQPAQVPPA